jgi:hypothetical protein
MADLKARKRLIARFGWAAGLLEDTPSDREERLRRYQRALERIAAGATHPEKIAHRAIRKELDLARR